MRVCKRVIGDGDGCESLRERVVGDVEGCGSKMVT